MHYYLMCTVLSDTSGRTVFVAKKRSGITHRPRRDLARIANRPRLPVVSVHPRSGRVLLDVEDRRRFHPLGSLVPARSPRRWRVRLVLAAQPARSKGSVTVRSPGRFLFAPRLQLAFSHPQSVLVCVRRARRKQVLHAMGVAGGPVRPPRRNKWSAVSCRRK